MGSLRSAKLGTRVILEAVHGIGRSERSGLRLGDERVSLDHAGIRWEGDRWEIRDFGSLNGTFVDGTPLTPGETYVLEPGARIVFGADDQTWVFESARPPTVMAISREGDNIVEEEGGLLPLPSADNPVVTLLRDGDGRWDVEPDGLLPGGVVNQAILEVAGKSYRICVPRVAPRTTPVEALQGSRVADLTVHFRVSQDLDDVELVVSRGTVQQTFQARSHFELLRVLARARRKDSATGVPAPNCGWLHTEDLAKQVKLDLEHVHVQIYRIREQFSTLGLLDPAGIVERRGRSRFVRFGVANSSEGTD